MFEALEKRGSGGGGLCDASQHGELSNWVEADFLVGEVAHEPLSKAKPGCVATYLHMASLQAIIMQIGICSLIRVYKDLQHGY